MPAMTKIHTLDCDEPIISGATVKVNCGRDIPNAHPVFMFEMACRAIMAINPLLLCRDCEKTESAAKRMQYGIVNAQEILVQGVEE